MHGIRAGSERDPKGSDRIQGAWFIKKSLPQFMRGIRMGSVRDPTGSDEIQRRYALGPEPVAIYERDPRGIRTGSHTIRRDPRSVVLLKSSSRVKPVAMNERDPCGIQLHPTSFGR